MARPDKNIVDYFPLWKPRQITENKFRNPDRKIRQNAIRNSSGAFIKRKDVREIVFYKDKNSCVLCGSMTNLTIDHIFSVYQAACGKFPLEKLNIRDNLQTLCGSCNSKKKP